MPAPIPCQAGTAEKKERAAFYIDGFNLYYSVVDLNEGFLKWANLWQLCEGLISKRSETLVKVVFCTAYNKKDYDRLTRHQKFVKALEQLGVTCVFGHFISNIRGCNGCGREWDEASEKETDVNLALHLFRDAQMDVYDRAYLLTADSDQAATARMLKDCFPEKKLVTVAPPGRPFSKNIEAFAERRIALSRDHLERAVMPRVILKADGTVCVTRPDEYAPPAGWVHPRARQK